MGILGQGTFVVDGQRTTLAPASAFSVQSYGPQTSGVPNMTPTIPPMMGGSTGGVAGVNGSSAVAGYGTADNNAQVAAIANQNPHSLKVSPLWWTVGCLVGGVLLLQFVSFRETIDEHGGKVRADADASAGD